MIWLPFFKEKQLLSVNQFVTARVPHQQTNSTHCLGEEHQHRQAREWLGDIIAKTKSGKTAKQKVIFARLDAEEGKIMKLHKKSRKVRRREFNAHLLNR